MRRRNPVLNGATELWRRYRQSKSASTEGALVEHYMPLAEWMSSAMSWQLRGMSTPEELLPWAWIGLCHSVRKYDETKATSFTTWSKHRMRGAILDGLRQEDSVSRYGRDESRRAQRQAEQARQKLGHEPFGPNEPESYAPNLCRIGSDEDGKALQLEDERAARSLQRVDWEDGLQKLLSMLPERDAQVLLLVDALGWEQSKVGRKIGLSDSRVSQVAKASRIRLRRELE